MNAMLSDCGMAPLDLRNPFDWLILYAICARRKRVHERPDGAGIGPFISGKQSPVRHTKKQARPWGDPQEARLFCVFLWFYSAAGWAGFPVMEPSPSASTWQPTVSTRPWFRRDPWTRSPASTRTVPWFSMVPAKRVAAPRESSPSFWSGAGQREGVPILVGVKGKVPPVDHRGGLV